MAGRMGGDQRTVKNVWVYKIDPARNLMWVKGQVNSFFYFYDIQVEGKKYLLITSDWGGCTNFFPESSNQNHFTCNTATEILI